MSEFIYGFGTIEISADGDVIMLTQDDDTIYFPVQILDHLMEKIASVLDEDRDSSISVTHKCNPRK